MVLVQVADAFAIWLQTKLDIAELLQFSLQKEPFDLFYHFCRCELQDVTLGNQSLFGQVGALVTVQLKIVVTDLDLYQFFHAGDAGDVLTVFQWV